MGLSRKVVPPPGFDISWFIFDTLTLIHWYSSSQSTPDVLVSSRLFPRRTRQRSLANAARGRCDTCPCRPIPEGHNSSITSTASHRISSNLLSNQAATAATHGQNKSAFSGYSWGTPSPLIQQGERRANSWLFNRRTTRVQRSWVRCMDGPGRAPRNVILFCPQP